MPRVILNDLNLHNAERLLCIAALEHTGSIVEAAQDLGITRRRMKRLIIIHRIEWPRAPLKKE